MRSFKSRATTAVSALALSISFAVQGSPAAAQATPDTVVSVCSGVSLPRSVVTSIIDPVVTGIYAPIETNINGTLSVLTNPLLGITGLPAPLSVNVNGLLTSAASGSNITLEVIAQDGTLVGPGDPCNAQADSFILSNPKGVSIGGNAITGLGASGQEAVAGEINSIAIGNRAQTDPLALGSIAIGTDATIGAGGTASVALGQGSNVTVANSVALGAGSVASRGPQPGSVGEVSVGAPGALRQITNVADGTAASDAATVGQLQAVATQLTGNSVQYSNSSSTSVVLAGAGGTVVSNVAAGALSASSSEAVNGSQLFATNQQVVANTSNITTLQGDVTQLQTDVANHATAIANLSVGMAGNVTNITQLQVDVVDIRTDLDALSQTVTNLTIGNAGPVRYSNAATPTVENGGTATNDVTLVGASVGAVRVHNVAAGVVAAGSTDAVNGGQLAATNATVATVQVTADQALALGQNAVAYDSTARTSVTLGGSGASQVVQLRNVAAGTLGTDAVNLNQVRDLADNALRSANAYTDQRLSALNFNLGEARKEARAGSAAALAAAGMPQAMDAGANMIAAGVGTYGGRTAIAIGGSHRTDDGKAVFRIGVTYDSSSRVGASGGAGIQF